MREWRDPETPEECGNRSVGPKTRNRFTLARTLSCSSAEMMSHQAPNSSVNSTSHATPQYNTCGIFRQGNASSGPLWFLKNPTQLGIQCSTQCSTAPTHAKRCQILPNLATILPDDDPLRVRAMAGRVWLVRCGGRRHLPRIREAANLVVHATSACPGLSRPGGSCFFACRLALVWE
jgi:hypothetical protein